MTGGLTPLTRALIWALIGALIALGLVLWHTYGIAVTLQDTGQIC